MEKLNERKLRILQTIIDDYILTAMPVGSRTIARKTQEWSSATIRNEMSDLEEMGYLDQPHTSSGRIPSDKAYRLYVNRLLSLAQLNRGETDRLRSFLQKRTGEMDMVIQQTARLLSDLTQYASIVLKPQMKNVCIRHFQLVSVAPGAALVVLVTDAGLVKDTVIRVPEGMSDEQLFLMSSHLNSRLIGRTLEGALETFNRDASQELSDSRVFFEQVLGAVERSLASQENLGVVLEGTTNLLAHPEYADINKARNFLQLLEDKDKIFQLMSRPSRLELSIAIGQENELEEMKDASVVTATYRIGGHTLGTIGLVGPRRMDYAHVIGLLGHMGVALSETLTSIIEGHE